MNGFKKSLLKMKAPKPAEPPKMVSEKRPFVGLKTLNKVPNARKLS